MNTIWDEKRLNQKIDRINNDLQTEPFNKSDIAYLLRVSDKSRNISS